MQSTQRTNIAVLVNNAALSDPILEGDTTADRLKSWRRYIDVNLSGPFIMTEVAVPFMTSDSSVIHISSTRAHQSEIGTEGYAASKAGLGGLTHAQAISLGSSNGIRVNCILPGWIDTGNYPIREEDHDFHCVGRVGMPQDIAQMTLFLADNAQSGFITGQEFVVDGGVSKKMIYPA